MPKYLHNSKAKDKIRLKWVEYAKSVMNEDAGLNLITLPAEGMQDLELFEKEGLIKWEKTETGSSRIIKGKVTCFETSSKIAAVLSQRLSEAKVHATEIAAHFQNKYDSILKDNAKEKLFPVDVINLDFDSNLSKFKIHIKDTLQKIFEFQCKHEKSFCLFLTLPQTPDEDEETFKKGMQALLKSNIKDPITVNFKDAYNAIYEGKDPDYQEFMTICLAKTIVKSSSHFSFKITKNEFFVYGSRAKERRPMISLVFHFDYVGTENAGISLYVDDVVKSLQPIQKI